jgi:SAM-dependent methyltransferase
MKGYEYKQDFFDFVDKSSSRSASTFLPIFRRLTTSVESILDVGCGRGVWIAEWKRLGVKKVMGVDGAYVDKGRLHIAGAEFQAIDISLPFDLERKFDLVECLEVAEHIQAANSDTLIDNIVRHGDLVLFSAAIPGQGGEHHVNEQPLTHWIEKFHIRGFDVFDAIRPLVRGHRQIEPWYRYNALVFANPIGRRLLNGELSPLKTFSQKSLSAEIPLLWRFRCAAIRNMPSAFVDALAKAKHRVAS